MVLTALCTLGLAGAHSAQADTVATITSTQSFPLPSGFAYVRPVQAARGTGEMLVDLINSNFDRQAALLDPETGEYTLIAPASSVSRAIGISADGEKVAFDVQQTVNGQWGVHVYLLDRTTGNVQQVDVDPTGAPTARACMGMRGNLVTPDGRFVAFVCGALRPYVKDLQTGQLFIAPAAAFADFGLTLLDDGSGVIFAGAGTSRSPDFSNTTDGYVYEWSLATGAIRSLVKCGPKCFYQGASGDGHLVAYVNQVSGINSAHVRNLVTKAQWSSPLSQKDWTASVARDGSTVAVWESTQSANLFRVYVGDPDHRFTALDFQDAVPATQVPVWLNDDASVIWSYSWKSAPLAWHLSVSHPSAPPLVPTPSATG